MLCHEYARCHWVWGQGLTTSALPSPTERELVLLKLNVPSGPVRTEVLQMAQIFRGRVVDVSDTTLTLAVTGDNGKCLAAEKVMSRFGIIEIARTGRICLKRGGLRYPVAESSIDDDEGHKKSKKTDAANGCVSQQILSGNHIHRKLMSPSQWQVSTCPLPQSRGS